MEPLKTMTYEVDGPIARVTLNRPKRGNGITLDERAVRIAEPNDDFVATRYRTG